MSNTNIRKILLGLIDRGGPIDDLNFKAGSFPLQLVHSRASSATMFAPNRLGPEKVTNGGFVDSAGWTVDIGTWAIGSGVASNNGGGFSHLRSMVEFVVGKTYRVTADVTVSAGVVNFFVGGYQLIGSHSQTGRFDRTVTVVDTPAYGYILMEAPGGGFVGSVDNLSVKEVIVGEAQDPISLVQVGPNVPRIHYDPKTGKCLGYLNEPGATNYILNSETPTNWTAKAPGAVVKVDDYYRFTRSGSSSQWGDLGSTSAPLGAGFNTGKTFTVSVEAWVDSGTASVALVITDVQYATAMGPTVTLTTERKRFSFTYSGAWNASGSYIGGGFHSVPNGVPINFRHLQVEVGSVATSYIPTYGAAASRAADVVTWPLAEDISNNSFCVEWVSRNPSFMDIEMVFEGEGGSGISLYDYPGSRRVLANRTSSPYELLVEYASTGSPIKKVCLAVTPELTSYASGIAFASSAIAESYPLAGKPLYVGSRFGGTLSSNATFERIRRFRRALTPLEMQVLTMPTEASISELGLASDLDFTLAALPTGVTFSRASGGTMICPNRLGAELVTNGSGTTTSGWTPGGPNTLSVESAAIKCVTSNSADGPFFGQAITLTAGQLTRVSFNILNDGTSRPAQAMIGLAIGSGVDLAQDTRYHGVHELSFIPDVSGVRYLWFYGDSAVGAGGYIKVNNISAAPLILHDIDDPISLVQVPADVPRFEYDLNTGRCNGLLVEPSRTNYSLYSETATGLQSLYTAPVAVTRENGRPALQLTMTGGTGADYYRSVSGLPSGQICTWSALVKLGTAPNFVLALNDGNAWNTIIEKGKEFTSADGLNTTTYKRVSFSFTSTGNVNQHYGAHQVIGLALQQPGTVFISEVQLELGAEPTSYIPTQGSAVTRAADIATYTLAETSNRTISAKFRYLSNTSYGYAFDYGAIATSGYAIYRSLNSNAIQAYRSNLSTSLGEALPNVWHKAAIGYSSDQVTRAAFNGGSPVSITYEAGMATPIRIGIGGASTGGYQGCSIMSRLMVFNRALSNQELKQITKV